MTSILYRFALVLFVVGLCAMILSALGVGGIGVLSPLLHTGIVLAVVVWIVETVLRLLGK